MNEALDKREIDPKITTFFIIHQKKFMFMVYVESTGKCKISKSF